MLSIRSSFNSISKSKFRNHKKNEKSNHKKFKHNYSSETAKNAWYIFGPMLFSGAVIAGSFYISHQYEFIKRELRSIPFFKKAGDEYVAGKKKFDKAIREYIPPGYRGVSEGRKVINWIMAINVAVYILWQFRPSFASRNFLHFVGSPTKNMVTSAFSHQGLFHLGMNMFVLNSFGPYLYERLGKAEFLAFYLSAAVSSSLLSHLVFLFKGGAGLGASGVLVGGIGYLSQVYPDVNVLLFFVIPLNIQHAVMGLAAFDFIGLFGIWDKLLSFRIGHAAHLGGLIFGLSYYYYIMRFGGKRRFPPRKQTTAAKITEKRIRKRRED